MRVWLIFVALVAFGSISRADRSADLQVAKSRYATAHLLFDRGKFDEALVEIEAAQKLVPTPKFDFDIGVCLERLGRPADAANAFQRYITAMPTDPEAGAIQRRIAQLRAQAVNPPAPDPDAAAATLDTRFTPPQPNRRGTMTRAAVVLMATGGAMIAAGAALGGVALSEKDQYDRDGTGDAHKLAIGSDVLVFTGAAAAVTSIVLFIVRPKATAVRAQLTGLSVAF